MFILLYSTKLLWIILGIIMIILNFTAKKSFMDREKSSPFECGFDPFSSPRKSFSLQFFLIAVIFIIFDVELALLLPLIKAKSFSSYMTYTFTVAFITYILIFGLYHEWKEGSLNWAN